MEEDNKEEIKLSPEMILMKEKIAQQRKDQEEEMKRKEQKIFDEFIPAIMQSTDNFIGSAKTARGLSEVMQMGFNTLAQKTKLKDLGLLEHLDKFTKGDPAKTEMFAEQRKLVELLGEWTVSDASFALQWFQVKSNNFNEKILEHIKFDGLLKELNTTRQYALPEEDKSVVSPIQPILEGDGEKGTENTGSGK